MKETEKHFVAFHKYCVMENRNLRKLADEVDVTAHTLNTWSVEFDWQRRLEQFDKEVAANVRESLVTDWAIMKRHLLDTLIDQLESAKLSRVHPTTTRDIVAVIKEIRSMVGDVTEVVDKREGIVYVRTITNDETSRSDSGI